MKIEQLSFVQVGESTASFRALWARDPLSSVEKEMQSLSARALVEQDDSYLETRHERNSCLKG